MKKLILIIGLAFLTSCTNEEESPRCFKIKTTGWYASSGYFVTNPDGKQINTSKSYKVGDDYCE